MMPFDSIGTSGNYNGNERKHITLSTPFFCWFVQDGILRRYRAATTAMETHVGIDRQAYFTYVSHSVILTAILPHLIELSSH